MVGFVSPRVTDPCRQSQSRRFNRLEWSVPVGRSGSASLCGSTATVAAPPCFNRSLTSGLGLISDFTPPVNLSVYRRPDAGLQYPVNIGLYSISMDVPLPSGGVETLRGHTLHAEKIPRTAARGRRGSTWLNH